MARAFTLAILIAISSAATACGVSDDPSITVASATTSDAAASRSAVAGRASGAARPRVVALGDSLTAGLGLSLSEAYPALLQHRIDQEGRGYEMVNAGVSGDTSAGALRRLDWVLEGDVRVLIVALGGNDGLRAVPVAELRRNLSAIIERAKARKIAVILAGMEAPPNFGPAYTAAFRGVYRDLAREHDVSLVPFLLQGVAGVASLNQRDGIHPTADGARVVADNVWAVLGPMLTHHD